MEQVRIGLIGRKFMGRAHTHAYTDLPIFFDPGVEITKKLICATGDADSQNPVGRQGPPRAWYSGHELAMEHNCYSYKECNS